MLGLKYRRCGCAVLMSLLLAAVVAHGQAPGAIQIIMPDGNLPARELRFTLTRDDGRIETLFTDAKGKFQFTRDMIGEGGRGAVREVEYTMTVESDGRSFDTTSTSFRIMPNTPVYSTVFLKPYTGNATTPASVVNVANLETHVPAEARTAYEQAMKAVGQGQVEAALGNLKRAVQLYPQYLRALNDLGVLYLKLNRLDEAAETLRQAVKINKRFPYPRLNLGVVLNRQGKYKEAADVLGALRKEEPTLADVRLPYAESLASTGRLAEAKQLLTDMLADKTLTTPAQAEAHFRLGAVLNREEHYLEAATELEQAAKLEPNSPAAHLQLGGALMQLKRPAEAERELLRAYELGGSTSGPAQLLLGQLYYMQAKYDASLRAFEQYLKDVPNAPNAEQIKSTIERLKAALGKQ